MLAKVTIQLLLIALFVLSAQSSIAQEPSTDVLEPGEWERVDDSVERALTWLASTQQRNGSFPTLPGGQPGVTSLCVMAFVAHGHVPGEGPYGAQLLKAVDYIVSCQKQNGLIALVAPRGSTISRNVATTVGNTAPYNHALSGLLLGEVYAMGQVSEIEEVAPTIEKGIGATLVMQNWPKPNEDEVGGWRYLRTKYSQGDLSVSGWQLMFLRSAKNAGFDVPQEPIDKAMEFIRHCYYPDDGVFQLHVRSLEQDHHSRGMAGAGILALAHSGLHDTEEARNSGKWILEQDFQKYNHVEIYAQPEWPDDRYHYSAFVCSQAMYQLGGEYWEKFFPPMVRVLLENQEAKGSWPRESHFFDAKFGEAYTTSLVLLALGAPNQLLPIFQR